MEPNNSKHPLILLSLSTLIYLTLLLLTKPDITRFFSSRFIGGTEGDAGLYIWLVRSFINDPLSALLYETEGMFPYSYTRAWSDNFFLPSAAAYFLTLCGCSLEVAYNTVVCVALLLTALFTQQLASNLGASRYGSLVAGALFSSSSYLGANLGHPQLIHVYWIPLAWSLIASNQQHCTRWLYAGLCISGAFYCAVYYAFFVALVIGVVFLCTAKQFKDSLKNLAWLTVGILPIVPSVIPYYAVKETFGSRHLYEAAAFSATGLSYFAFDTNNFFYNTLSVLDHAEARLGFGIISLLILFIAVFFSAIKTKNWLNILLLAVIIITAVGSTAVQRGVYSVEPIVIGCWTTLLLGILIARRDPSHLHLLLCIGSAAFILSLGPLGSAPQISSGSSEVFLSPFTVLFSYVPGFEGLRATARFGVIVILCGSLLLGLTLSKIQNLPGSIYRSLALLLIPFTALSENQQRYIAIDSAAVRPSIFDKISPTSQSHPAVAVVLPFATDVADGKITSWLSFASLSTKILNWGVKSNALFINGYSGQRSKIQTDFAVALKKFPSSESVSALSRICGLSKIVVIPSLIPGFNRAEFESALLQFPTNLAISLSDQDGNYILNFRSSLSWGSTLQAPLLSPQSTRPSLKLSSNTERICSLKVSEYSNSKDRGTQPTVFASAEVGASEKTLSLSNTNRFSSRPLMLTVQSGECNGTVRCDLM